MTVTFDSPASGGVDARLFPEDIRYEALRVLPTGSDVGAGAEGEGIGTPRAEAREYTEFPLRRLDCMSDKELLAVRAGSGNADHQVVCVVCPAVFCVFATASLGAGSNRGVSLSSSATSPLGAPEALPKEPRSSDRRESEVPLYVLCAGTCDRGLLKERSEGECVEKTGG